MLNSSKIANRAANSKVSNFITSRVGKAFEYSDVLFAFAIMGIIMVLLFPVPTFLLDFLLSISITSSVIILMTCLFINRPLDLSSFPAILLVSTILRLSLNIASTRLILSNGHSGTKAAGGIIESFGHFIMSNNVVIGIIVFGILTIINFIVITKGSGRIAEVAARFSLDAMPGKQMAIDADLSSGLIDEVTAKARRKDLEDESTFFGSMDGANKFVRGDAIAGLLITFINFIGGMVIGIVQRDLTFAEALKTYTILTIGDGLVSQIPSLIVSLAAGLLVSKSGVTGSTEKAIFGQIGKAPQALWVSAVLMFLMAILPGIPATPFIFCSAIIAVIAWTNMTNGRLLDIIGGEKKSVQSGGVEAVSEEAPKDTEDAIVASMQIETIKIELGYALLSMINNFKGTNLTDHIKSLRRQLAKDLGFILPSVRMQDNMQISPNNYSIYIKEIKCGEGFIKPDMLMVMNPLGTPIDLNGEMTTEPAFGLPAMWVAEAFKEEAIQKGYTVVDPITVITTHLTEIVKDNINDLLSYTETQKLLDGLKDDHRRLITDIVPSQISISAVQKILQNLLSEMVSIRDLPTILEAISEIVRSTKNVTQITEYVRTRLARQISNSNAGPDGSITAVTLSPGWEQLFMESIVQNGDDRQLNMQPSRIYEFMEATKKSFDEQALKGEMPVMVVSPIIRPFVRSIIERFRSVTIVMSHSEIHHKIKLRILGQIG